MTYRNEKMLGKRERNFLKKKKSQSLTGKWLTLYVQAEFFAIPTQAFCLSLDCKHFWYNQWLVLCLPCVPSEC
jgi:hypothetical protein